MSFEKYKETVEEGDTVVLYLGYTNMLQMTVEKSKTHQTRYGALKHSDLIGKKYGSKINCSKGWLIILHPTPELWTINLPHRTQILYTTDISLVTFELDLKPGSVVIEAGTGSASLSHAILRTIAPSGHLYTFDFHEKRAETARAEFKHHGFGDLVTAAHRDVCREGFDKKDVADAVFLDLPLPWEAAPYAKDALKQTGGRICSFSPCIEQVQKMCLALEQLAFSDIKTVECLIRTYEPKSVNVPMVDLGFEGLRTAGEEYEDVSNSAHKPVIGGIKVGTSSASKRKNASRDHSKKKKKIDSEAEEREDEGEEDTDEAVDSKACFFFKSGITLKEMPGHTGFLTFATLHGH